MVRSHCPTQTQTPRPTNCNIVVLVQCEQLYTILYNPIFIGVCIGLGVGQCEHTITLYIDTTSSSVFVFYRLIAPLGLCVPKNNSLSTQRCCTTGACVGKRHRHWEAERTSWRSYRATSAAAQTSHSFFTERTDPDSHQSSLTLQFKYVISLC